MKLSPFVTAKQLATILPFRSSQILTGLSNLIPGELPFALFKAIPREHLADIILSSCIRYTFTSLVEMFGQYRSQVKAFLIFVHLECSQLKKPFNFMLSFSLSMTMPSALWWQSISSLMFEQCPRLQLNTPVNMLHSLPLLQLYLFILPMFTYREVPPFEFLLNLITNSMSKLHVYVKASVNGVILICHNFFIYNKN